MNPAEEFAWHLNLALDADLSEKQDAVRARAAAAMLEASETNVNDPNAFDVHHRLADAIALYGEWILDD